MPESIFWNAVGDPKVVVGERPCVVFCLELPRYQPALWQSCAGLEKIGIRITSDDIFALLADQVIDLIPQLSRKALKEGMSGVGRLGGSVWLRESVVGLHGRL